MVRIECFIDMASSYSYLTVGRIVDRVSYRPFLLGPIFQAQGFKDSPFNVFPAKGQYMWRDIERRCDKYGLPYKKPTSFPRNSLRAARIATALDEEAVPAFVKAVLEANFAHDRDIADESVLADILGRDAATVIELSKTPEIKLRLRETTERAQSLGIFGAPSFVVSANNHTELFWGDDRLEDALALAAKSA